MYLAHNITASTGGSVLGIFSTYQKAKDLLKTWCKFEENTTDWSHFIRILEIDEPFAGVYYLPRADERGKPIRQV